MKKFISSFLLALAFFPAFSLDFTVEGINYSTTSDTEVEVGYNYNSSFSGTCIIPESVSYEGKNYKVTSIRDHAFSGNNDVIEIQIPNSVTIIGKSAFESCNSLTSISIPNSVTFIGSYAFSHCERLISVNLPTSITTIEDEIFTGCHNLTDIEIPNSVISISYGAFADCIKMTRVIIPSSVKEIEQGAFWGCYKLSRVEITDLEAWLKIKFSDWDSNPIYFAHHLYLNGSEIKNLVIPNSITVIEDLAFRGCYDIINITIPNSVTSIGENAFARCINLKAINVDSGNPSYSSIEGVLFSKDKTYLIQCPGGKEGSYTIPDNVYSIGTEAFAYNSGLVSIKFPSSVSSIGEKAFEECIGLSRVEISDIVAWCAIPFNSFYTNPLNYAHHLYLDGKEIKELVIPNSIKHMGKGSFWGCSGLTNVKIPDSVISIGTNTFSRCDGLTNIEIPNSVTKIESSAFSMCKGLINIYLGENLREINDKAFDGCGALKKVVCRSKEPPKGRDVFYYSTYEEATLYVPENSLDLYLNSYPWSRFLNIETIEGSGVEEIFAADENTLYDVFNMNGVCVKRGATFEDIKDLTPGIYIINGKKLLVK